MAVDPDFAYRKLVCPFDYADDEATQSFGDKRRVLRLGNGASITTARSKFGRGSLAFNAAGYAVLPVDGALDIAAQPFTWECYLYILGDSANGNETGLFLHWNTNGSNAFFLGYRRSGGTNSIFFYSNGGNFNSFAYTLPLAQWFHFAAERNGGTVTIYINGVAVGTIACANPIQGMNTYAAIGGWGSNAPNACMDSLRFTLGKLAYGGPFTPPAAPHPTGTLQASGVVRDASGAYASRTVRAMRRDTGMIVCETVSDPATGAWEIQSPYAVEHDVLCLDDAAGVTEFDLVQRVIPA